MTPWLRSRMLFKLRVLFHYLSTRYFRSFQTRAELLAFQDRKIKKHLKFVLKNSLFYRSWFGSLGPSAYRSLPFLDKKIMMENFTLLNTVGIDRDEALKTAFTAENTRDFTPKINGVTVGLSSGTSGSRGLFLVSDAERARHAGTILAKVLPHGIMHHYRVAFFMRANSNLYTASQGSKLDFKFFDLLAPLDSHLAALAVWKADLIFAPPSMLLILSRAVREKKLKLSAMKIYAIAEALDPLDEAVLVKSFGQKIHQIYQCTEGFLAATCSEGTLHLNEDCVQIEPYWLDAEKTKFMPIITDFTRTSQPMIRYRLNDILTPRKEACSCGSVFQALESIEGRADDLIYFEAEDTVASLIAIFPDFLRRAVIQSHGEVDEYLIRQTEPNELTVSLHCPESKRNEVQLAVDAEIQKLADTLHARKPQIVFSNEFPALAGKKLRRIVQECASLKAEASLAVDRI